MSRSPAKHDFIMAGAVATAVFSIDTPLPSGAYVDLPIEALALTGLACLPFVMHRNWLVTAYLTSVLASAVLAGTTLSGLRYVAVATWGFFLLPQMLRRCQNPAGTLRRSLVGCGVALAIWILLNPWNQTGRIDLEHGLPFTGSKLSAGFVLSIALCAALCRRSGLHAAWQWLVPGLLGVTILLLEARAPIFSLGFAVAVLAWRLRDARVLQVAAVVAVLLMGFQWITDQDGRYFERIRQRYVEINPFQNDSFEGRLDSWETYWSTAARYPWGMGYERSIHEFSVGREAGRTGRVAGAHSEFLKLLVEVGWLPFAMFVWLNGRAMWRAVAPRRRAPADALGLLLAVTFAAMLPQLAVNNEIQQPEVGVLYWFMLGNLLQTAQADAKQPARRPLRKSRFNSRMTSYGGTSW